jgi:hypothetical protein
VRNKFKYGNITGNKTNQKPVQGYYRIAGHQLKKEAAGLLFSVSKYISLSYL